MFAFKFPLAEILNKLSNIYLICAFLELSKVPTCDQLNSANTCWRIGSGEYTFACVNGTATVGKHVDRVSIPFHFKYTRQDIYKVSFCVGEISHILVKF